MSFYKITPLEKKSISQYIIIERKNADGSTSTGKSDERWRWGWGILSKADEDKLDETGTKEQLCDFDDNVELEDSISTDWSFSDDIDEQERERITKGYNGSDEESEMHGISWLAENLGNDWEIVRDYIGVLPPYKVELCDADGMVIKEIKPKAKSTRKNKASKD